MKTAGPGFKAAGLAAVIREGKIEQSGSVEAVFNAPETPFVARFVGMKNLLPARFADRRAEAGAFRPFLETPAEKARGWLAIRPEGIRLLRSGDAAAAENGVACRVEEILPRGILSEVRLRAGETPVVATATTASLLRQGTGENDRAFAAVEAARLHVLQRGTLICPGRSVLPEFDEKNIDTPR